MRWAHCWLKNEFFAAAVRSLTGEEADNVYRKHKEEREAKKNVSSKSNSCIHCKSYQREQMFQTTGAITLTVAVNKRATFKPS